MKKKIIFCALGALLLAALIFVIIWFGMNTAGDSTVTTGDPTESSDTISTTESRPAVDVQLDTSMVSISLPVLEEADVAGDGTVIFRRTYQDVVLSIPNGDIAQAVTLNLLQRMDVNSATLTNVQSSANVDYTGQYPWQPYYYEMLYSAMRVDEAVLSLYGIEDVYSPLLGGYNGISVNYNLRTGSVLTLKNILSEESNATESLLEALLESLEIIKDQVSLFSDYQDIVTGRFQTDLEQESGWYFSSEGLCFFFAPYDIAPNASGIVVTTVPYSKLSGILQDIYFPAAQPNYNGQLLIDTFDEADLTEYKTFSELITDPSALRYVLHTDGVLYDLKVEQGHWDTGDKFQPDAVIYYTNRLSPSEAIILRSSLEETSAPLRIRYNCDDAEFTFYVKLSDNGVPIVVPVK